MDTIFIAQEWIYYKGETD